MASKKTWGTALAIVGVLLVLDGVLGFALQPAAVTGVQWTTSWAQDTTCGYGFTAVTCWTSTQMAAMNGPQMTVTDLLTVKHTGPGLDKTDIAFTITVKNNGPPVYGSSGEIAQPVYMQVTSWSQIVSSQGVPLNIVNYTSLNQITVGSKDFSGNSYIIQGSQFLLGTLLSGASNTAKLGIQLQYNAFSNSAVVAQGNSYYISGNVNGSPFKVTVYITSYT